MKKVDFSNYKFRASSMGRLMVQGKNSITQKQLDTIDMLQQKEKITEKQQIELARLIQKRDNPELSATTKSYLLEVWVEEVFGRRKDFTSKFTEKGNYAEEDSLTLVTNVRDQLYLKNKETLENEWVRGTPDIILADKIIDIKTKWDLHGYVGEKGNNQDYYYQLQTYMWLTGKKSAELIYTLVNTPEHLIVSEKSKRMYQDGLIGAEGTEDFEKMEKDVEFHMIFDDIAPEFKVKAFEFQLDYAEIGRMKDAITLARNYLEGLNNGL